ncbi:MAG TPA: peptide deformylase [Solirubrobacteraceae bacterium]|nr:peptide deformylase [Solirubrobacteraceae bacterium]
MPADERTAAQPPRAHARDGSRRPAAAARESSLEPSARDSRVEDVEVAPAGRTHDAGAEHMGAHAGEQPLDATAEQTDADADEQELGEREPAELDEETRARRDAALRHVRKLGDPVLRASALPVERFDAELAAEVARMGELMHDALGVGLAATQLGVLHRVLVYKAYVDDPLTALVNPVLEWTSDELEAGEEGCLSLPGVHVEVERHARVRVRAQDETGKPLALDAEGLEARVIQHEIDHLDGVLILDRISREARKQAMRAMREHSEARERSRDAPASRAPSDEPR